jgi:phosphate transport system permease protein
LSLGLIFIFIGKEALPIFISPEIRHEVTLNQMILPQKTSDGASAFSWQPVSTVPKYSLLPLLLGTFKATLVALLFAIPLALGAAIYTAEFAPGWVREIIKPVIELLAGIPSVVLGFFSLMILASVLQDLFNLTYRLNALNSGIALGLCVIPIVYTVAEDALSSVPHAYREGSLAMGATTWQTALRVAIPAASPGIFAACILGLGRAIGETMIVLMASGNAPIMSLSLAIPLRSFSATIAAEMGEVVVGSAHYSVLFFIGTLLFVITFATNLFGQWFVDRLKRRLLGTK